MLQSKLSWNRISLFLVIIIFAGFTTAGIIVKKTSTVDQYVISTSCKSDISNAEIGFLQPLFSFLNTATFSDDEVTCSDLQKEGEACVGGAKCTEGITASDGCTALCVGGGGIVCCDPDEVCGVD